VRTMIRRLGRWIAEVLPPTSGPRAVVLAYHSVHPSAPFASATPQQFVAHLQWIAEHCEVVPLTDIKAGPTPTTRPRVALTFDDGFVDNYVYALPRIAEYGFTATFFLIARFMEGDSVVRQRLARLWGVSADEVSPLTWGQVHEMRAEGMEFGSHTWSHQNLARLDDEMATHELVHSKEVIEDRLGEMITALAYPFGKPKRHVTDRTISLVARAGYEWGVLVLPRGVRATDSPLRIPRFAVGGEFLDHLPRVVSGEMDGHGILHGLAPKWLDTFASRKERVGAASPVRSHLDTPRVSAIITSYNYARFLPNAVDSVLAQTYPNVEVVIVDDGSNDQTRQIAARYVPRGVRYVYQPHSGPGQARNRGLQATSGPLVAYLDADDTWLPDKLSLQVGHLKRHPELALVGAHAFGCDESMRISGIVHAATTESGRLFERLLVDNVALNPSSVLIRRSALEDVGGFSEIPVAQDWDTWLRIAKAFPIGFVDRALAKVRHHTRSLSPMEGRYNLDIDAEIVDRHLASLNPAWKRPIVRLRARSASYFHAGVRSVVAGDLRGARRFSILAVLLDPFTLARRKAALVLRVWVSEALVERLRRAFNKGVVSN
jgi:glycosyltransferase involved in cell wall biosynthesis/peptidoglycan/xylan/chitin deacetylase (PgdA/CDA1 family)